MAEKAQFDVARAWRFLEDAVAKRETPDLAALFAKMETPDEAKARREKKAG